MTQAAYRIIITCMGQNMTLETFATLSFQRAQYGYGDQASLESAGL